MEQREIEGGLADVLSDVAKAQEKALNGYKVLLVTLLVSFTIIVVAMVGGFFYYESQFETTTTTTTTTSTTMETEGESANINNVTNGNQYNDEATHNE